MTQLLFRDCLDYVAIDADKGINHRTGKMVHADDKAPAGYARLPKCKFCTNYQANDGFDGICQASPTGFMAYGDMAAVTCKDFNAIN